MERRVKKYKFFNWTKFICVLNKTKMEKINFAFIDGMHDYYNVKKELNFVKERQSIGDIIICDDYDLDKFEGVVKALNDEDFLKYTTY